jgi:hypothetical protein
LVKWWIFGWVWSVFEWQVEMNFLDKTDKEFHIKQVTVLPFLRYSLLFTIVAWWMKCIGDYNEQCWVLSRRNTDLTYRRIITGYTGSHYHWKASSLPSPQESIRFVMRIPHEFENPGKWVDGTSFLEFRTMDVLRHRPPQGLSPRVRLAQVSWGRDEHWHSIPRFVQFALLKATKW